MGSPALEAANQLVAFLHTRAVDKQPGKLPSIQALVLDVKKRLGKAAIPFATDLGEGKAEVQGLTLEEVEVSFPAAESKSGKEVNVMLPDIPFDVRKKILEIAEQLGIHFTFSLLTHAGEGKFINTFPPPCRAYNGTGPMGCRGYSGVPYIVFSEDAPEESNSDTY